MKHRSGFTWPEFVVAVVVLAVLLGLLLPAIQAARERARRTRCANTLKQCGLAVHNYATANRVFPPGTITATDTGTAATIKAGYNYGVTPIWGLEAFPSAAGRHGTSWLLRVLPYIESAEGPYWDYTQNVGGTVTYQWPTSTGSWYTNSPIRGSVFDGANPRNAIALASCDIKGLYCPARRSGIRPGMDNVEPTTGTNILPNVAVVWKGGGTDYGGCVGRHVAYDTNSPSHTVLDAAAPGAIVFDPGASSPSSRYKVFKDGASARRGIFGRINVSTKFSEIKDGTSSTIMTGELQRITTVNASYGGVNNLSHDAWAVGGDATGFTTGYGGPSIKINGQPTPPMNNGFFQSPGSDHPGGANFGLGDGSVEFISTTLDPNIFALLGSMADGVRGGPDGD